MHRNHTNRESEQRIKIEQVMAGETSVLHELDFQDVLISTDAVRSIKKAAAAVMNRFMPGSRPETLTNSQAVALFIDRVFWDQNTRQLVLCADIAQRSICIPIPSDHWNMKTDLGSIH